MSECKDLKPTFCGQRGLDLPSGGCSTVRIEGADDVSINQGVCIDLTEGVHAYDGDGSEIEYTVTPSEIGCCDVGEHEVTYKAVGKGSELVPSFCMSTPMLHMPDCGIVTRTVKRIVTILQALPPKILGIERKILRSKGTFDALEDVYGIDDNGEETVVTFNGIYDDATSGDLITVNSVGGDSKGLKVKLNPIQDLNGYDKPWSGGVGTNQWDEEWESGAINGANGGTYTDSTKIRSKNYISVLPNTDYYVKMPYAFNYAWYDAEKRYISGDSSATPNYTRRSPNNARYLKFSTAGTTYNHDIAVNYPSTVTTYSPYSNICPISGHTDVVTHRTGVNLFDGDFLQGYWAFADGSRVNSNAWICTDKIPCKPSTTYTLSANSKMTRWQGFVWYDENGDFISTTNRQMNTNIGFTAESPSDAYFFAFNIGDFPANGGIAPSDVENCQIEYGSTATDYEPYNGDTYTTSLGQTVYGGTLDVVSGELVVDRAMVTLDGTQSFVSQGNLTNTKHYSYDAPNMSNSPSVYSADVISDKMPTIADNSDAIHINHRNVGIHIWIPSDKTPSVWFAENPTIVVYPLANPQTIHLTPQEVELLTGTNNVWSDGLYHPLVKRYLKNNSWTVQALNGVTYYVNQGYGYMNTEPFSNAPMSCSHFKVTRNVEMPTSTSTPLADNGVYLATNGRLLVRYDAVQGADVSESNANWLEFIEDSNVYLTVPSYGDTEETSLHISELGYPKQMPSGEFMFQYDGVYEVTYDTEDSCGNHTTETRLIYVGNDWSEDSFSPMACLGKACAMTLECSEDLPIVCHGTVCNAKLTCLEE